MVASCLMVELLAGHAFQVADHSPLYIFVVVFWEIAWASTGSSIDVFRPPESIIIESLSNVYRM